MEGSLRCGSSAAADSCVPRVESPADEAFAAFKNLLYLSLSERQLPDERVGLIDVENTNEAKDRVDAVLGAAAAAAAGDFRADLDLEFPSILILHRQFRRPVLLH